MFSESDAESGYTHRLMSGCDRPTARGKYASRLWVCPECGQAWQTTRQQPHTIAPTGLSWWWRRWPLTKEGSVL